VQQGIQRQRRDSASESVSSDIIHRPSGFAAPNGVIPHGTTEGKDGVKRNDLRIHLILDFVSISPPLLELTWLPQSHRRALIHRIIIIRGLDWTCASYSKECAVSWQLNVSTQHGCRVPLGICVSCGEVRSLMLAPLLHVTECVGYQYLVLRTADRGKDFTRSGHITTKKMPRRFQIPET
jgi:hypothetical protein